VFKMQNLNSFRLPDGFRGRSAFIVQLWWIVEAVFFRMSPQFCYPFRAWLLRIFGAKIGKNTIIRPTVKITYPWKISIGDYSWIGDDVVLYSLGYINIGDHAVVSQRSYLCAADHDYKSSSFTIRARDIAISSEAWVATDVFIGPGVIIGKGVVIGARSSVFNDMPDGMICFGSPCKPVKKRIITGNEDSH